MTDNVTKLYTNGAAKNPDSVLKLAIGEYEDVFIIGHDKEGLIDIRASTNASQKEILWMLERFKHNMINGYYDKDIDND